MNPAPWHQIPLQSVGPTSVRVRDIRFKMSIQPITNHQSPITSAETEWTIECYNGGEEDGGIGDGGKCLTQERSGATAAEYGGRLFVIGGFHGTIVDVFDGVKFTELEEDFPNIVFGSSALFWRNKLWCQPPPPKKNLHTRWTHSVAGACRTHALTR